MEQTNPEGTEILLIIEGSRVSFMFLPCFLRVSFMCSNITTFFLLDMKYDVVALYREIACDYENNFGPTGHHGYVDYDLCLDLTTRSPTNKISISLQRCDADRIKGSIKVDNNSLRFSASFSDQIIDLHAIGLLCRIDVLRSLTFREHQRWFYRCYSDAHFFCGT